MAILLTFPVPLGGSDSGGLERSPLACSGNCRPQLIPALLPGASAGLPHSLWRSQISFDRSLHLPVQLLVSAVNRLGLGPDYHLKALIDPPRPLLPCRFAFSENLPQSALDAIPIDRGAYFSADRQPQTTVFDVQVLEIKNQGRCLPAMRLAKMKLKLLRTSKPILLAQSLIGHWGDAPV
jgi:hypothetical protein